MSRRGVSLEGKHDQMVMFTLVELMTHLIFLALILGFALRKEQEVKYQQQVASTAALVKKCGLKGEKCAVIPPSKTGRKPGGQGLANCLGGTSKLLSLRALSGGGFSITPATVIPPTVRTNPTVAPLLVKQTLTKSEFGKLGRLARQVANAGQLGQGACNFTVDLCRAHGNFGLFETQWNFAQQFFNVPGPRACH